MRILNLGRWGLYSAPPVLRLGLPQCLNAHCPGRPSPCRGTNMDTCTLHRRPWHFKPGWGPQSRPKSGPDGLWTGLVLGPVWGLHSKTFLFHESQLLIPGALFPVQIDFTWLFSRSLPPPIYSHGSWDYAL